MNQQCSGQIVVEDLFTTMLSVNNVLNNRIVTLKPKQTTKN